MFVSRMITLKVLNSIVLLGTSCMFVKEANMEEKLFDPPPSAVSSRVNSRAHRTKHVHTAPQKGIHQSISTLLKWNIPTSQSFTALCPLSCSRWWIIYFLDKCRLISSWQQLQIWLSSLANLICRRQPPNMAILRAISWLAKLFLKDILMLSADQS